jgi:3-oxoacyl-[acyl-carrier protein] reductase
MESMPGELQGKCALVGGASQGIGQSIVELFAGAGARVILMSRSQDRLEQVKSKLPNQEKHVVFPVDLETELSDPMRSLLATVGAIDIVVNNSGGPASGPLTQADSKTFEKAFRGHVLAYQQIMQAVLPGMKDRGYGRFINVISTSVKVPIPNLGVSNTVRAAVANWSKTLALEVAPFGITVNNILPGYTKTPRLTQLIQATAQRENKTVEQVERAWIESIPVRRFAEPREIAEAALFLASPRASFVNGTNLVVDGGRTGCL